MARLQRKKASTAKKKKKKGGTKTTSLTVQNDVAVKMTEVLKGPVKDVKKRPSSPQTKALARTRTEPGKIKSYIDKALQFLREVKVELKKVAWPTRKQTIGSTAVVLVLVMIISLFLGVVDIGLSSLIRVVFK